MKAPWPDLPELEARLERAQRRLDLALAGMRPDAVIGNYRRLVESYERDIAEMKKHHPSTIGPAPGGAGQAWHCPCGATGAARTTARARQAWAEHVEQAVWG